jgi:hypothetical protein
MAAVNRHLRGDTNEIEMRVHGNTVVEKGDLMVIFKTDSTISNKSSADYYGYPVSSLADVTGVYYEDQFAGIAMKGSESGTTETIPVATSGIFRYPLLNSGVTVQVGYIVSGASSAAKAAYDQKVTCKSTQSYMRIGYCVKRETSASNVDFALLTKFSGSTVSDIS